MGQKKVRLVRGDVICELRDGVRGIKPPQGHQILTNQGTHFFSTATFRHCRKVVDKAFDERCPDGVLVVVTVCEHSGIAVAMGILDHQTIQTVVFSPL